MVFQGKKEEEKMLQVVDRLFTACLNEMKLDLEGDTDVGFEEKIKSLHEKLGKKESFPQDYLTMLKCDKEMKLQKKNLIYLQLGHYYMFVLIRIVLKMELVDSIFLFLLKKKQQLKIKPKDEY